MPQELIHKLAAALGNQFLSGGLILMMTGSIIALLRNTPGRVWDAFKKFFTVQVDIPNDDPLFDAISYWLHEQPYSKRARRLTARTRHREQDDDEEDQKRKIVVVFSPAPGDHFFIHKGRFIWLSRSRDKTPSAATAAGGQMTLKKYESYEITTISRNQMAARSLMEEVVSMTESIDEGIRVFSSSFGYWNGRGIYKPRDLSSVILPVGVAESLREDILGFLDAEQRYQSLGIPWHRGYLFHGIPGSGKTSLVSALAGELRLNLYLLNLSGGMSDERLHSLMSAVRERSIVLLEDIDATQPERSRDKKDDGVTLSGLLNCLDGLSAREGCLVFMTTNARHKLDEALLRPGRVDREVEFAGASEDQIVRFYMRLRPEEKRVDAVSFARKYIGISMASVQQKLLAESDILAVKENLQVVGKSA